MKNYIKYNLGNNQTILIESDENTTINSGSETPGYINNSLDSSYDRVTRNFSDAVGPVKVAAENIFNTFKNISDSVSEIELEVSLKVSAEGGFIITKGSIEGNFKVTLKWSKEKKIV